MPRKTRFIYPMEAMEFFKKTGAEGGKKAAENMTKKQRIKRALKAARARWKKAKGAKKAKARAERAREE